MPELQTFETCPVCGTRDKTVLATVEQLEQESRYRDRLFRHALPPDTPEYMFDDLTRFTNAYPAGLVVCCRCGLVGRDPRFTPQGAVDAYAAAVYHPAWLEAIFQRYRAAFRALMPDLVERIGPRARVLEVGSYVGGFLAAASEYGWQAQGLDVGRCVSEFVREKGLHVLTGSLFDTPMPEESFDAVFVWVCFDQLPDARAALVEMHRILIPNGLIFLQVPNGDFVKVMEPIARNGESKRVKEPILKSLAFTGLAGFPFQFGYTSPTLRTVLQQSGFRSIEIHGRTNLSDSKQYMFPEQGKYLQAIHQTSRLIRFATAGKAILAPWIQVSGRKKPDSII